MADAQGAIDRFRALLEVLRENNEIERNRVVCVLQAEVLEEEARCCSDEMPDGDIASLVERQSELRAAAAEYREQARAWERKQGRLMWKVEEISPSIDSAA